VGCGLWIVGGGFVITSDLSNSGSHSASLGGVGGKKANGVEYEGIYPRWEDHSSDMVPVKAWNKLKHAIDAAGLRMEYQADYRAECERLRDRYGLPLLGGKITAGYQAEVWIFKRWHMRVYGAAPSRWPWQSPEES
jgi:hypothetical protein